MKEILLILSDYVHDPILKLHWHFLVKLILCCRGHSVEVIDGHVLLPFTYATVWNVSYLDKNDL